MVIVGIRFSFISTVIFVMSFCTRRGLTLPANVRVGGLFEHKNQAKAFKYAIEKLNMNRNLLPRTTVVYDVQEVRRHDSFHASKKVCGQIEKGVVAIFGPISPQSSAHVQIICDALEIPHIQNRFDPNNIRDYYSLNVYPYHQTLSQAYLSLIRHWQWEKFAVLYENNYGLLRVQEILRISSKDTKITVRQLPSNGHYYSLLKELREEGAFRFVVDCDVTNIHRLLQQALQIQMVSQYYHYIFTTLDLAMLDLSDFMMTYANITALQLVNRNNPMVNSLITDWSFGQFRRWGVPIKRPGTISTETALIYDAVHVLAHGLRHSTQGSDIQITPLSCDKKNTWKDGGTLQAYMRMVKFDGLSGFVSFDGNGLRTDFNLDVIELNKNGISEIGKWNLKHGLNITKSEEELKREALDSFKNKTLIVTAVLEEPYTMQNPAPKGTDDVVIGFCPDILRRISQIANFSYVYRVRNDKRYGSLQKDGTWDGMVRELMDLKADLAVAGMTITYDRERVIDFTKPFLNLGITILYRKPEKKPPKLFSFLQPLSTEVWVYIVAAYLCVSFMLFVLARFSPYEWYNPHPCNVDSDIVENQFTVLNSLWFTIGSFMQQGSDLAPRALSTRLVSGIWWFFTLIMISSYTANLAAFLTFERMTSPITNADDLAKQTKIKYGTLRTGSTKMFFERTEIPTFKTMWKFMSSSPSVFSNSTRHGVQRVLTENYAYLAESTTVDYEVQKNCNLAKIGGLLDDKNYGIATPRGSKIRDKISEAILKLKEDGVIHKLYKKWWRRQGEPCPGNGDSGNNDPNELDVNKVGGIFVVLLIGLAIAIVMVVIEFLCNVDRKSKRGKRTMCGEITEEFRLAIQCMGSDTKQVQKYDSENGDLKDIAQRVPLTGQIPFALPSRETYT